MSSKWWYLALKKKLQAPRVHVDKPIANTTSRETGRNLPPRRVPNKTVRTREYLTPAEVAGLIQAANRMGRHRHRDAVLILIAYRHGLRVSELVSLRWEQVDFAETLLRVTRLKNGTPSNHPIECTRNSRAASAASRLRRVALRLRIRAKEQDDVR